MHFHKLALVAAMAAVLGLTACSKKDGESADHEITATTPVSGEASTLTERNAQQRLTQTLQQHFAKAGIQAKILNIRATEIPNMYWVTLDGLPAVLASADGKYIFQGEVVRLGGDKLVHVTEELQAGDTKQQLANLKIKDLIVYPAQGKTKHTVYVFTDSSCPYCHRLHGHLNEITAKGIEVRYVAWPRGEQFFPIMKSIWCSKDRKAAFEASVSGEQLPPAPAECQSPVEAQYQLGLNIGVNGTPAIYDQNGYYLGGYMTPEQLEQRLNQK